MWPSDVRLAGATVIVALSRPASSVTSHRAFDLSVSSPVHFGQKGGENSFRNLQIGSAPGRKAFWPLLTPMSHRSKFSGYSVFTCHIATGRQLPSLLGADPARLMIVVREGTARGATVATSSGMQQHDRAAVGLDLGFSFYETACAVAGSSAE